MEQPLRSPQGDQKSPYRPAGIFCRRNRNEAWGSFCECPWKDLNLADSTLLYIPVTKTDVPRTIPLTSEAQRILAGLKADLAEGRIFPLTPEAAKLAWKRLTDRAEIKDLHFHDLRHEK